MVNTAELMIRCLEAEDVKYIFGIPGEETLELINAIEKSDQIKFIPTRHEQGAAFMADVYGRLTGKAGVCLSTLGPGATNLVTGVADANMDGAPLVAITGQAGTDRMHLTSHQAVDLVELFKPVTKRSKQIMRPDTVPEIVRIAFKYAESEKPGAVHIDLPCNIAAMDVDETPMKKVVAQKEYSSYRNIEKVAALISKAKRPLVLAGSSAVRDRCGRAITEFAERLHIPVLNTMMGKGLIPWTNKYSMWTIGGPKNDYQYLLMQKADLVICIGYDLVEFAPINWNADHSKKIIHIGPEAAHINKRYEPAVELVGDIKDSIYQIIRRAEIKLEPDWAFSIKKEIVADYNAFAKDSEFPVKPQKVIYDIRTVMGEEDILICDVGAHKMWCGREYNCSRPNTCIISNGFASMGIALPGAIAAKLVSPDKNVLAFCGDGGFMMNVQELEVAVRLKLPVVVFILTDCSYGLIKWKQDARYGFHCSVDFTNPDFAKLAESFGCTGVKIQRTEDIVPTLKKAFTAEVPTVIECPVDYSQNMKLTEKLNQLAEQQKPFNHTDSER
jgi:acetolactate synthase-1/2/3 large subunit